MKKYVILPIYKIIFTLNFNTKVGKKTYLKLNVEKLKSRPKLLLKKI